MTSQVTVHCICLILTHLIVIRHPQRFGCILSCMTRWGPRMMRLKTRRRSVVTPQTTFYEISFCAPEIEYATLRDRGETVSTPHYFCEIEQFRNIPLLTESLGLRNLPQSPRGLACAHWWLKVASDYPVPGARICTSSAESLNVRPPTVGKKCGKVSFISSQHSPAPRKGPRGS